MSDGDHRPFLPPTRIDTPAEIRQTACARELLVGEMEASSSNRTGWSLSLVGRLFKRMPYDFRL